jgi:uncharacterized damage-inducible protein DinB
MTIERTDPPHAADEVTLLRSFLNYYRATFQRQTDGLAAAQLNSRLGPSMLTLGGLLKHLAYVEHFWFIQVLLGQDPRAPWATADWDAEPDWDFQSATADSPEYLSALFYAAVADSNTILDGALEMEDLDQLSRGNRRGEQVTLRWILIHLIEEYARHCGHADLIRESVDGATDL